MTGERGGRFAGRARLRGRQAGKRGYHHVQYRIGLALIPPEATQLPLPPPSQQILGKTKLSTVTVTIDATILRNVTAYINDPKGCAPAPATSLVLGSDRTGHPVAA